MKINIPKETEQDIRILLSQLWYLAGLPEIPIDDGKVTEEIFYRISKKYEIE